jgi:subtilase family serine protease
LYILGQKEVFAMRAIPESHSFAFLNASIFVACIFCVTSLCPWALGQEASDATATPHPLITHRIDESQLTTLGGNTYPLARPEFDFGMAPASLPMERMVLVLKRSPEQELALRKLLDNQQDKNSPDYHKWLTPEEFGKQFGPTDSDMQTITTWLKSHGFQVGTTKGRTVLEFSGSASQVQEAFHSAIHKYIVKGEQHWANDRDPQIPTALTPVVAGIDSLHSFRKKPLYQLLGVFSLSRNVRGYLSLSSLSPRNPLFTVGGNCGLAAGPCYALSPYDLATIYNILPLWNATSPINGTGQTIAIVSQSDIYPQDFSDFRQDFGLPVGTLNIIYNGSPPDKLASEGDELESDLDVQWSGAVAKGAIIDLVESISTNSTAGVDLSALFIVDNNIAPILSVSYGACELDMGTAGNQFYYRLWQQAAAQGISVFVSTGDSGSAVCDRDSSIATQGLSVNGIASTPYNVAVGGTDFADLQNQSAYWNSTNDPVTFASAKGYVPESSWNDTCTNSELFTFTSDTTAERQCNDSKSAYWPSFLAPAGGSGGASNCTTSSNQTLSSCGGGYEKPTWQSGPGVPNDGTRDLPDVSLFAGDGMNSSFYLACETDMYFGCAGDVYSMVALGGTSASAPAFAGIMAMINQKMQSRQGNPNYVFYALAAQPGSSCDSTGTIEASCIFHDVTTGTIAMACVTGTPNCVTNTAGDANGVLSGYSTTPGYDLATGLGSVNVSNLADKWSTVTFQATVSTLSMSPTTNLTHGSPVNVTITVSPTSGAGTPLGMASLVTSIGQPAGLFTLSNGAVSGTTEILPGGSYTVTAHYAGDGTYATSDSTPGIAVTVAPEPSTTTLQAFTLDQNGSSTPFTSGPYGGAIVYLSARVAGKSGQGVPTGTINLTQTLNGGTTNFSGDPFLLNSQAVTMLPFPGYNWWAYSPGTYTMGATYSGDGSFEGSTASSVTFSITPAQTSTTTSIAGCTPVNGVCSFSPGQSVTIFASVNYSGAAFTGGVFIKDPTGAVTFYSNGAVLGSPVPVDSSINPPIASINTTLSGLSSITAQYSGDSNFAGSTSSALLLAVGAPFLMTASPHIVNVPSPGQSASTTLTITAQKGFAGAVSNFSCAGLPPGATCSFNPTTVPGGSGSTTLTITTTPLGQMAQMRLAANESADVRRMAITMLPLLGVCLIGIPAWRRRRGVLPVLMMIALMLTLLSCGGGGGGGGVTPPSNNPVPSIKSLSPAEQAAGSQSQTLTINGSGLMSSSIVTYNAVPHTVSYTSASQISISLSASDLATTGTYPVVVTNPAPGGGASNPVNFGVVTGTPTGTFNLFVTATSGPLTDTTDFALVVQ